MIKLLQLRFLPASSDLGLLVLRLWFGLPMLILHGWPKLSGYSEMSGKFMDFLGIGQGPSLMLAIFGELVCSGLIVLGLFTRFAAVASAITMGVAFFMAHGGKLSGPGSGEMAYLYLGASVVLFFSGAGRFSVDAKLGAVGSK